MSRVLFAILRLSGVAFLAREFVQRRRTTILVYHEISPDVLDRHLLLLGERYSFIALRDYIDATLSGNMRALPAKPMVITIDDGCRSVYELAEVFRSHRLRPTVFLCSGIADTSRGFWWRTAENLEEAERWKRLPHEERIAVLAERGFSETAPCAERVALSRAEIEATRDAIDYQAHTVFHPILPTCSDERSWLEIEQCKRELEEGFGIDVYAFAYPDGAYSDREVECLAKAGYACAVTTEPGYNDARTDVYALKRIGMGDTGSSWLASAEEHAVVNANEVIARASGVPAILKGLSSGRPARRGTRA